MTTNTQPRRRRLAGRIGYAAAGWAALYATVALIWTITGDGFPFGKGDPDSMSALRNLPTDVGAPAFAGVLVATAVVALVMTGSGPVARPARIGLLTFGWLVAGALLVVVPDPSVLALAGYAPVLLLSVVSGWPDVDYAEVFTWPLLNQAFSLLGGFLVAGAVLAWQRRTRPPGADLAWTTPAAAARWGRWAVALAVAIPLSYAATRYAWLVGFPVGVTEEFIDDLHADGAQWAGAWLATFGVIGAILTLGLVRPWGERFPRWMLGLAGRRVPVMLAVVPASVVSALVASAGLGLATEPQMYENFAGDGGPWALLPSLLWPVWGVALAAATLAYYLRRRGASVDHP